ncbi:MAG: SoxR reducing system RseC family protein [Tissierellia bacterium]|nr:SoxR reducing system RseC family protein [Tissierellia bacterium]
MAQIGFVRRLVNDKVELEIQRSGGCGSCNKCGGSPEKKMHILTINNSINAKVGDYVEVQGESKDLFKYTLIVYMIPFIFLILGIALGHVYFKSNGNSNYELLSFGVGVVFLFISALIVKYIDKKVAAKDASTIIMTRIL